MVSEGNSAGEYRPFLTSRLLAEAVLVLRAFGFASSHAIVVGGLAPSLLVPKPDAGLEPHVGTQDLDLCLSIALVNGDVGAYQRLENSLRAAGFEMAKDAEGHSASWRWRGGSAIPLIVEFFCPTGPGREAGALFRPGGVVGGRLSAMALSAGRLIDLDVVPVEVAVDLPSGGGATRHVISVAGPAAYLASKADALRRRSKNKDAYDVVWLAEAWPGGQPALADVIRKSRVASEPDFRAALDVLREEFRSIDAAGAVKYARFLADDGHDPAFFAQKAVGAVGALLEALDLAR